MPGPSWATCTRAFPSARRPAAALCWELAHFAPSGQVAPIINCYVITSPVIRKCQVPLPPSRIYFLAAVTLDGSMTLNQDVNCQVHGEHIDSLKKAHTTMAGNKVPPPDSLAWKRPSESFFR